MSVRLCFDAFPAKHRLYLEPRSPIEAAFASVAA
jgi:hypothetical protein